MICLLFKSNKEYQIIVNYYILKTLFDELLKFNGMKFKFNRVTLTSALIILLFGSYYLCNYLSTFLELKVIIFFMNLTVLSIATYFVGIKIVYRYVKFLCKAFLLEENNFSFNKVERYRLLINAAFYTILLFFCQFIYTIDYKNEISLYSISTFFIAQLFICFIIGYTFSKRFENNVKGYNYEKIAEKFNPLDQIQFNEIDRIKWYDYFIYDKVIDAPFSEFEKFLDEKSAFNKISIIDIKGLKNRNKQITYSRIIKFFHEELIQGGIKFSYEQVFLKQFFLHWICDNFTKGGEPITYKQISSAYTKYFSN